MVDFLWVGLAVFAAIGSAGIGLVNQYFRHDGLTMAVLNKFFQALFVLPVVLTIKWPDNPLFYVFVFFTAILALYTDTRIFNIAARYGGGMVSRVSPLFVPLVFLIWLIIKPDLFFFYLSQPFVFAVTGLSVAGCAFFATILSRCEISRRALREIAPVLVLMAAVTLFNKLSMDSSGLHAGVYCYIFVQGVLMCVLGVVWLVVKRGVEPVRRAILSRGMFKSGVLCAGLSVFHLIAKNYAFKMVPDPSYVAAIGLSAPLWVLLFYRLTGHREEARVWPGIAMVACIAVLVLFAPF